MITWGLCALPPAAGLAGRHSLGRIWGGCDCQACIWKCHKNTLTFARASLRLLAVLIILDWALSVLPYTQFSMDTNILPDVSLLALPISRHLNGSAKVGWFCLLRRSSGIWVPEPCSTVWSPACYSILGLTILDFLWEPEHLFFLSSSKPWLLLLLPSTACEALVQWMHPSTKKIILFCLCPLPRD